MQGTAFKVDPQFYKPEQTFKILIGAAIGIAVGLFFGERTHILAPLSTIYTMLLEVAIFPYIITTLLSSIGKLSPKIFGRILKEGWVIYLFLIIITFGCMVILAQALPAISTSLNPVTPTTTNGEPTTSIINLIIPDNFFAALANNYVPAVVVFCILFGFMLQRIKKEQVLFNVLDTISNACLEYWNFLIKLAPIGAFLIFANVSGTINFEQIQNVSEFIILFIIGTILLGFWLIPALISSLTKFTYREIIEKMFSALIIAMATTLTILALPRIKKVTQNYLLDNKVLHSKKESEEIIDTILLVSYPLAHIGSSFLYLFILFAAMYFNQPITREQNLLLPIASYLSSIGSPSIDSNIINFLATFLNLPTVQTNNLYDSISTIIIYGQILVSVMGFAFLSILITSACFGHFHLQWRKFFTHLILVAIVFSIIAYLGKLLIPNPGVQIYKRLLTFELNQQEIDNVKTTMAPPLDEKNLQPVKNPEDSLFRIQRTGVLRVGYNPDTMPFSFLNNKGQLVGHDVAYMYDLAQAMNVNIEFVPFTWYNSAKALQANKFDIAIGGIIVSPSRLEDFAFTDSYIKSRPSFITLKNKANQFTDVRQIQRIPNVKIGVGQYSGFDPFFGDALHQTFPNAQIIVFPGLEQRFIFGYLDNNAIDAMLWLDTQSRIWTLGHPKYESITPVGLSAPFVQAFMVQSTATQFLRFLNYWLELRDNDGFQKRMYQHWILAQPLEKKGPRWSIMDNILHWNF